MQCISNVLLNHFGDYEIVQNTQINYSLWEKGLNNVRSSSWILNPIGVQQGPMRWEQLKSTRWPKSMGRFPPPLGDPVMLALSNAKVERRNWRIRGHIQCRMKGSLSVGLTPIEWDYHGSVVNGGGRRKTSTTVLSWGYVPSIQHHLRVEKGLCTYLTLIEINVFVQLTSSCPLTSASFPCPSSLLRSDDKGSDTTSFLIAEWPRIGFVRLSIIWLCVFLFW